MCWHHLILGASSNLKVEILFKSPINTGFDIIVIGPIPSGQEQTRIRSSYNEHITLTKFRGGIQNVLFYETEDAAGILDPVYGYTLSPFGMCMIQANIKTNLKTLGINNFLNAQSDYNNIVRVNPSNAQTILKEKKHI